MYSLQVEFYEKLGGRCPFIEFIDSLPAKAQAKCLKYVDLLEEKGLTLPANYIKKISGAEDLWELRPEYAGNEYRFLFFKLNEEKVIIVHAIIKKDQKLNQRDIKLAQDRIKDYLEREGENL